MFCKQYEADTYFVEIQEKPVQRLKKKLYIIQEIEKSLFSYFARFSIKIPLLDGSEDYIKIRPCTSQHANNDI